MGVATARDQYTEERILGEGRGSYLSGFVGVVTRKGSIYRGMNTGGGGYISGFVGVVTRKGSIYRGKNTGGGPRELPIWFCGGCDTQGIYI